MNLRRTRGCQLCFEHKEGKGIMKLQKPKVITFWISVALAVVGILAFFKIIPVNDPYGFWILLAGFVLLGLGNLITGL
jgi:predicted membrane channel-forming protein YqfA (hemolysin III family)